jgi:hypothetical protein
MPAEAPWPGGVRLIALLITWMSPSIGAKNAPFCSAYNDSRQFQVINATGAASAEQESGIGQVITEMDAVTQQNAAQVEEAAAAAASLQYQAVNLAQAVRVFKLDAVPAIAAVPMKHLAAN